VLKKIAVDLLVPTAVYYGARALGVDQTTALVLSGVVPALRVVQSVITERRINGMNTFVLAAVALGFAMSFVTGEPRVLLVRAAWGTAAFGLLLLGSLWLAKKPLVYSLANQVLSPDGQRTLAENWERYPALQRVLRGVTAIWGVMFLADTAVRVVMALTLPIDLVPALDDALLVVLLVLLVVVQRLYARFVMRRAGLRINGLHVTPAT
jgi:uncharacterized membrane protein